MNLLRECREELAVTLTKEEGKILRDSRAEVARAITIMEFAAGEGRRLKGSTIPSEMPNTFVYTIRQPVGVCGIITPWNFPVAVPIWKLAPALVAGNSVVFKPSTYTPFTAVKIVELFEEAGLKSEVATGGFAVVETAVSVITVVFLVKTAVSVITVAFLFFFKASARSSGSFTIFFCASI